MENGQKFTYKGIEFIKLDDVEINGKKGALCITSEIWEYLPFNHNWRKDVYDNFKESDIKRVLNTWFLKKLNKKDLLEFEINLGKYGTDKTYVGLLTVDQYEKYKDFIPNMDFWWWLVSPYCSYGDFVCIVGPGGSLIDYGIANRSFGAVPVCVFESSILESPSLDGMTNMAKEFKRMYSQRGTICDYCRSEDYCPSDCKFIEKAKSLTDKQWIDIAQKYDIDDIDTICKSIMRRKA